MNAELGFQDAALQVSELAMQVLREQAALAALGSSAFLSEEFSKRGIPHGTSDLKTSQRAIHDAAIVQTHSVIDGVLRQLAREYQMHKWISGFSWTDDSGNVMSPIEVLLTHLPSSAADRLRRSPECALMEYYRLLRVSVVHRNRAAFDAVHAKFEALTPQLAYFSDTYKLEAPKPPNAVDFQDFQLYTRSIKFFANVLNDACDLSLSDICDFLVHKDRQVVGELGPIPKAKQFGALRAHAQKRYGLASKESEALTRDDLSSLRKRIDVIKALNAHNKHAKSQFQLDPLRNGTFILTPIRKKSSRVEAKAPSGPFDADAAISFLSAAKPTSKRIGKA